MLFRSIQPLVKFTYLHHSLVPIASTGSLVARTSWIHTSCPVTAEAKSDLAKLRKNTGYSLSICKKALGESNNDLGLAEKWLKEQAQAQGWAKAQKLQGRNTSQGLMGVKIQSNVAALVELNCETDFVARNKKFIDIVKEVATKCVETGTNVSGQPLTKTVLTKDQVGAMRWTDGKTLADLVALNIGQIGENIALGGVTLYSVGPGVQLSCLSHPSSGSVDMEELQCGRYASLLAFVSHSDGSDEDVTLARQICQHIIGMAPTCLNDENDKENSLLHQSFLLDENSKVQQILESANIEIVDFVRAEVGRSESE